MNCMKVSLQGLSLSALAHQVVKKSRELHDHPIHVVLLPTWDQAESLQEDLQFFCESDQIKVLSYPSYADHLPQDSSDRMNCLFELQEEGTKIVVLSFDSLLKNCLPLNIFRENCFTYSKTGKLDKYQFISKMLKMGYQNSTVVEDIGTISSRGDIIDIFPPGQKYPVRIELFDDEIEEIREFDPISQRSIQSLDSLRIAPCSDFIYPEDKAQGVDRVASYMDEQDVDPDVQYGILQDLRNELFFHGIEDYLSFFYEGASLLDYITGDALFYVVDHFTINEKAEQYAENYIDLPENKMVPYVPPFEKNHSSFKELWQRLENHKLFLVGGLQLVDEELEVLKHNYEDIQLEVVKSKKLASFAKLREKINSCLSARIKLTFVAHFTSQIDRFKEILKAHEFDTESSSISLQLGNLSKGFISYNDGEAFITEEDVFGVRKRRPQSTNKKLENKIASFSELKEGDVVVHLHHGKGIYKGMEKLDFSGVQNDYLIIEYKGGDKIYLPVYRLNILQKYSGGEGASAKVDKLGGKSWDTVKQKAKKNILEIAGELLKVQAVRDSYKRPIYTVSEEMYREFEASFAFEETEDQMTAIEDVIDDMSKERPMDRLVCGDVGYGKTEIAMRAAFRAVLAGRQVAILVPTTVLCFQHYQNFKDRLRLFAVRVEMVNRFVGRKEQRSILEEAKQGKVDILVGTHRLLSKDIDFKDLGLLIVDEEQRFGVTHKEKLKKFKNEVDVLTLSATPIPRTLHMSIIGIRDLSLIATPPADRRSIKTYVAKFEEKTIIQAIESEIKRGGQVFFVHNRVENIAQMADFVQSLVPAAKVRFGHGQMAEQSLENLFIDFINQRFNVLVCTTIIESGLDLPNVNTIIINRADMFGLAQLYQLKGRVGRSNRRAYAWLLIPGSEPVSDVAKQRLEVIQTYTELGSGFSIAGHDMDIRGVGNLLGSQQSGQIAEVGFELYTDMLKESIDQLKGKEEEEVMEPEITLGIKAFIPNEFIKEQRLRLQFYKQIAMVSNGEDADQMLDDLEDRFGNVPEPVKNLIGIIKMRAGLKRIKAYSIKNLSNMIEIKFNPQIRPNVELMEGVVSKYPRKFQLTKDFRILINTRGIESHKLISYVLESLQQLDGQ